MTSLSVLVPVYNEQYLVQTSLRRLAVLAKSPLLDRIQVIVVDDCSRDQSAVALESFQQELRRRPWDPRFQWVFLRHEQNQGKGGAIRTALEHAECELTVVHDADLEYHPQDLLAMIPLFADEDADAVYGSRFMAGEFKRALFFRHSLGNHVLTLLCDLACDLNLTDMETCYKMVRTDLLRTIPLESRDFRIEPEITIKLAKRGARFFEVPIRYSGRTYQEGKKIGWKDGVQALLAILRFRLSDQVCKPDRYGSEVSFRLNRAPNYIRWIADLVRPHVGARVLEIGAGSGNLTLNLVPRTHYRACDPNPFFVRELKKLVDTRPYLSAGAIDPADVTSFPAGEKFETIICQNMLEHLEDDGAALRNLRTLLQPGGQVVALVPHGDGLYGSLDGLLGHCRRYSRAQLRAVAQSAGFRCVRLAGFNRLGSLAWWLDGRVLQRRRFSLLQIKALNWLVPLLRHLDRFTPLPPLTLLAVLEPELPENPPRHTGSRELANALSHQVGE